MPMLNKLLGTLALLPLVAVTGVQAATTHGCACIHNKTDTAINYRYKWGEQAWQAFKLKPAFQNWVCWKYGDQAKSSPNLVFQLDVDMTAGNAWTTFSLPRMQSTAASCEATPKTAHYDITYRPNTNKQFIQVTHR